MLLPEVYILRLCMENYVPINMVVWMLLKQIKMCNFLLLGFFWQYLCYYVNVDFMTGKDKMELYLELLH